MSLYGNLTFLIDILNNNNDTNNIDYIKSTVKQGAPPVSPFCNKSASDAAQ